MQFKDDEYEALLRQFQPRKPGPLRETLPMRHRRSAVWLAAAAAVVVLGVASIFIVRNVRRIDALAVVETADGSMSRIAGEKTEIVHAGERIAGGTIVHANGGTGGVLMLSDGSRVEMRSHSALSLERADDGLRIRLNSGGVIVNAAKQRSGHLDVQTKDVTVSVVGTVFLVNAEEVGSRVAVIEGEVRVQQGATEKKLLPGQQIATSPLMEPQHVSSEIAWSRHALAHLALLQEATADPPSQPQNPASVTSVRQEFGTVSIKSEYGPAGRNAPMGFVCHGVDGVRRAVFERTGATASLLTAPQGTCVGSGLILAQLISFAFGVRTSNVSGIPDWGSPGMYAEPVDPVPPFRRRDFSILARATRFEIEAVATDPSTATVDQLMQMVRSMLADRFKLKFHRETQEMPGYALVVGKNGPKLKLKEATADSESPYMTSDKGQWMVPGLFVLRGKSTLTELAQWLASPNGVQRPVVDRTGLSGVYDYEVVVRGGRAQDDGGAKDGAAANWLNPSVDYIATEERRKSEKTFIVWLPRTGQFPAVTWSVSLEETIGLQLQEEKAIPVEIIVIDSIEKPSQN